MLNQKLFEWVSMTKGFQFPSFGSGILRLHRFRKTTPRKALSTWLTVDWSFLSFLNKMLFSLHWFCYYPHFLSYVSCEGMFLPFIVISSGRHHLKPFSWCRKLTHLMLEPTEPFQQSQAFGFVLFICPSVGFAHKACLFT